LASYGVSFHSFTEAHLATDNELVRNILLALLASLAKVEAQKISERTKAGMARARAKGKSQGKEPRERAKGKSQGKEPRERGLVGLQLRPTFDQRLQAGLPKLEPTKLLRNLAWIERLR
jgi:DNA invertase Pin-like site-specific DNA recombinase